MVSSLEEEKSLAIRLVKALLKGGGKGGGKDENNNNEAEGFKKIFNRKAKISDRPNAMLTDPLSSLPACCLLEIFKNVSKYDLHNVLMAFNGMLSLQINQSLKGMRWEEGALTILKTEQGYGIQIAVPDNSLRLSFPFSYSYEICKAEDGSVIEKSWRNYTGFIKELRKSPSNKFHTWPIPYKLYIALTKALQRVGVTTVRFDQIPLSLDFLSQLETILAAHNVEYLACSGVTCDESEVEIRESFARFISHVKSVSLKRSPQLNSIVNEDFLRNAETSKLTDLMCDAEPDRIDIEHIFRPDQSMLPLIERFNTIEAVGMELDVNWVVPMIMMHMDREDQTPKTGGWKFAVSRPIDSRIIRTHLQGSNYGMKDFVITRKSGLSAAKLFNTSSRHDDGTTRHIVFVHFTTKRSRIEEID